MQNKIISGVIGFVISISLLPVVVSAISDLTGTGGALEGSPAAALLDLAPLLFVATVVVGFFWFGGKKKD